MMLCSTCKGKTIVLDTRKTDSGMNWRRRECMKCNEIFNTVEQVCEVIPYARKPEAKRAPTHHSGMYKKKPPELNIPPPITIAHPSKPSGWVNSARMKTEAMREQRELDAMDQL